jgi:cytoskeletal protein RodZ
MSSPSRRPSAAVYRRRRLVALLLLLVIVVVVVAAVWVLVAQPWRGSAAEPQPSPSVSTPAATPPDTPTPVPTETSAEAPPATPSDTPTPQATQVAAPACTTGQLAVEAVTDKTEYPSGENPQLSIRLTNKGAADCTINVGTTGQAFTITSGSDTWWRSTDCQTEPSDMVVTLAAGQTVQSATPLTWDRTRSSVDSCTSDSRERAPGGGSSYHLSVSIGGVPSAQTAQFMLY